MGRLFAPTSYFNKEMLFVEFQFLDTLAYVVECPMVSPFFCFFINDARVPSCSQFFDRADVDHPVMEELVQIAHVARDEPAILPDGITAKRAFLFRAVRFDERQCLCLGFCQGGFRFQHCLPEARFGVVFPVPIVHALKQFQWLMDDEFGTFRDDFQIAVGQNGGHFKDDIAIRVQSAHLHVDPHEGGDWLIGGGSRGL